MEKNDVKADVDDNATDDKKEKLEFVFWKGLCDVIKTFSQ
jgi:hypothetical protein